MGRVGGHTPNGWSLESHSLTHSALVPPLVLFFSPPAFLAIPPGHLAVTCLCPTALLILLATCLTVAAMASALPAASPAGGDEPAGTPLADSSAASSVPGDHPPAGPVSADEPASQPAKASDVTPGASSETVLASDVMPGLSNDDSDIGPGQKDLASDRLTLLTRYLQSTMAKVDQIRAQAREHALAIQHLKRVPPDRRAWQMKGTCLVQGTAAEVLPEVEARYRVVWLGTQNSNVFFPRSFPHPRVYPAPFPPSIRPTSLEDQRHTHTYTHTASQATKLAPLTSSFSPVGQACKTHGSVVIGACAPSKKCCPPSLGLGMG